jgi:hypothetical protein
MYKLLKSLPFIAALLFACPGQATILAQGSEDIEFTCFTVTGNCAASTDNRGFRSSFVREAYTVSGAGATNDPPTNRFATATFANTNNIWFHAQYCQQNGGPCNGNGATNATVSNSQMIRFMDNVGNPAIIIRGTGTAGQVKVSSRTAGGVFTDLVSTCSGVITSTVSAPAQVDVFVNLAVSGQVTVYASGVQVCNFTGDTTNGDGATGFTSVEMAVARNDSIQSAWSEVIVADVDTRSKAVLRLTPLANGNATQWTGTNICSTLWPVAGFNDSVYASSSTNNQLQQCTVFNTFPGGTWRVDAVVMSARALRGVTGPQHFQWLTRTGAADFTSSDVTLTAGFANYQNIQNLNPQTSAVWAVGDLTAAGFNLGLKSTP